MPTQNTNNLSKDDDFGCMIFKTQLMAELLTQIDERVNIIEFVFKSLKNSSLEHMEGINLFVLWRTLYLELESLWIQDKKPVIILNKLQELKFVFILDFVTTYFEKNGDKKGDKEFLENANEFFEAMNESSGKKRTTFVESFKEMKEEIRKTTIKEINIRRN